MYLPHHRRPARLRRNNYLIAIACGAALGVLLALAI